MLEVFILAIALLILDAVAACEISFIKELLLGILLLASCAAYTAVPPSSAVIIHFSAG